MQNIEDLYVLSPIQSGMLFHSLYAPGSGVYVIQVSCALRGDLNIKALEQAWQQVVQRHAILRSSFVWETLDRPLQAVHRRVELPFEQHDWRALTPAAQQEALAGWLKEDRRRGFALDEAPLMRLVLVREADKAYRVIWSYHHLLLDGWSMQLLLKEVFTCYQSLSGGVELPLPPLRQYRDYIAWLQPQSLAEAETYWRMTLKGFTSPTIIARKRERKNGSEQESYAEQRVDIDANVTAQLQQVCRDLQVTTSTAIQAAWALVLMRYSGEKDVVFGAVVSGRSANLTGVERMIGPLINTLPVRMRVAEDRRVSEWLREAQEQGAVMRQFEFSPLVEVQRWSEVTGGEPLFENILVYENYPVEETVEEEVGEITLSELRSVEQTNYPLTLLAVPGDQLVLRIIYEQGRFEHELIANVLKHLACGLEEIASNPHRRISEFSLLTTSERQQLENWNRTKPAYPQDKCVHELFAEQVERTPEAIAVEFEGETLTYRELNGRANQLARHLNQLGADSETIVGVCMERSLEMVVALYGTLKSGAAYLPLDPAYPQARLQHMLEEARVRVVLTQQHLLNGLPPYSGEVVCLDTQWTERMDHLSNADLDHGVSVENLAYTIYTSGSTGKPKAAMNSHRGIVNRLLWMQEAYQLNDGDRVLQKTPFTFDVSVWEFFWPLLNGARLVVARPGGHQDAAYLVKVIGEQQITTVHFVPSMLQLFVEQPGVESCRSLRQVICSGEALRYELQERFFARLPAKLHNLYGPTEAAVDVTYWECRRSGDQPIVPIGRPIANLQMYVLNREMQRVPVGVAGELYIGGAGVGRGYLNRPDLTAERFVPDPFGTNAGARLYRTGDLGRYLFDGAIEFLGRVDYQVKVRGQRIELGEIEAALVEHEALSEAAVVAREDEPGAQRLVAYLVARNGDAPPVTQLRQHLQQSLPDYMIPSAFVVLEALPLTSSGKVDRRALPPPDGTRPDLEMAFVAPADPVEESLAAIWREVLGLERVGVYDDFFASGGHSLLAAQVISRIQRNFGVDLALRDFFGAPNIRALAERISEVTLAAAGEDKLEAMLDALENIDEEQAQNILGAEQFDSLSQALP
ncbi:MAG TPA: amino acid adenylation domain-containing protein [Pyrinomonadaceae bacterium]|nr:amino acid adenylation domain-containing protein [Pyrinomonadaceae bacterium]